MADCTPEKSPCASSGFTLADWGYSIFKRMCELIAWLATIRDVLGVNPSGSIAIVPSYFEVDASEGDATVTVPAGALSITATIDPEYASENRLSVIVAEETLVRLPLGVDLSLPPITPVFSASSTGTNATRGHGLYPETKLFYPEGSTGTIVAIFPVTGKTITQE